MVNKRWKSSSDNKIPMIRMKRIIVGGVPPPHSEASWRPASIKMQSDIDQLSQFEVNSL